MNKVSRKREIIGSTYKVWDSIFSFIEVEKKKYIQNLLFKFKLKIWNKDKKRKKNVSASKIESSINEQVTKNDFP